MVCGFLLAIFFFFVSYRWRFIHLFDEDEHWVHPLNVSSGGFSWPVVWVGVYRRDHSARSRPMVAHSVGKRACLSQRVSWLTRSLPGWAGRSLTELELKDELLLPENGFIVKTEGSTTTCPCPTTKRTEKMLANCKTGLRAWTQFGLRQLLSEQ
jgi:hypothetical protein